MYFSYVDIYIVPFWQHPTAKLSIPPIQHVTKFPGDQGATVFFF